VLACAALYPFEGTESAEIACIATHPDYRNSGRGMHLLDLLTTQAKDQGISQLFVLTTQTTHWFIEQGFVDASLDQLPSERQALYNLQRNSKVLIRDLD
jgi:amino-acid N-acetyltransferase